ncbi:MAG: hypothetical protein AB7O44_33275 [Hyphomicrobiaceae bacterium]
MQFEQLWTSFTSWCEKPFVLTNGTVLAALIGVCVVVLYADYRRFVREIERQDRDGA